MKKTLFYCFFWALPFSNLCAQPCDMEQYKKFLAEADNAVQLKKYQLAFSQLLSAKKCQPGKEEEVNRKVSDIFDMIELEQQQQQQQQQQSSYSIEKAMLEKERALLEERKAKDELGSALFAAGKIALNAYEFETAVEQFTRLLELKPGFESGFKYRGLAKRGLTDYDGAVADLDASIALNPKDAEAFYFRGLAHQAAGNYSKSIEDYNTALLLEPSNPALYICRGDAQREAGNYTNALADYTQAASLKVDWAKIDNDPNRDLFLRCQFPFPPPLCRSPREIPLSTFSSASRLGDIANKLSATLEKKGYLYRSYMSVPNGFALVTQMERFNEDYTCIESENRWSTIPIGYSFDGFLDYFKRLLMPEISHFRTFIFVVTPNAFDAQNNKITKSEAEAWFGRGIGHLPKFIADQPIQEATKITALVYEFTVPESNRHPDQKCPHIETQRHLEKSGIWNAFFH